MNLLFVHQGFPGQFIHILRALHKRGGYNLVGLGISEPSDELPESVKYFRYELTRGNQVGLHPWAQDLETKVLRGEPCAQKADELKKQGFVPDLICGHPGWGELLFLQDVWPSTPILTYQEFFYNPKGFDYDFDPEFQCNPTWEQCAPIRIKNANQLLNLELSTWSVSPTHFQRSSYPYNWQNKISVIHDGIDTSLASPAKSPKPLEILEGVFINPEEQLITFVNRTLEPYRGCHTMLRAIPQIQRLNPDAKVIIVGEEQGVSYGSECPNGQWKDVFLQEIEGQYDIDKVIFTGKLDYSQYLCLLQLSKAHVYLSYPFVLSWSLLEAMSTGCAIVGSATDSVKEVIQHNQNGLLVNFFNPTALAESISELLNNREKAKQLGNEARKTILERFELNQCVEKQINLINLVAHGAIGEHRSTNKK